MVNLYRPAPHIERLPADKIDATYRRLRLQVFLGIFIGYAGYYLVRKNFSLAIPYFTEQGFSKGELGLVLSAVSIAYGISKFVMGIVSDRCNPRYFLATGLILSGVLNILFGTVPFLTSSIAIMFVLMFINGWFQGMGWPPSGRTMVHWFSISERGTKMSIWNVAHNVGGGITGPLVGLGILLFATWKSIFFFPGIIAVLIGIYVIMTLRDTPQSVGLPPIEEYKNEYPDDKDKVQDREKELTAKEILFKYVLNNKFLWFIALANVFVYFVRYGVVDWAPTYLTEAKGFSHDNSRWSYFLYEYAGIPGTLLCGWMSDRLFKGRRAPAGILFMVGVLLAVIVYWVNPPGNPLIDNIALISIGFLIYGPVMLIGLHALDLAPKKAAGTAAGLTGLFGYLIGATFANAVMGYTVDLFGWDGGFIMLIAACLLSIFFLALTWNTGKVKH
ncbi:glycerol-3-phosphate transporter [Aneurinibacillus thermoaerophilus]|uniref:Glycerol-3-phosphate transporter n=1 Tax=Aneurinibacillus thermoaerophilus TaxID=143495 RepID=A0ABX8YF81_ANETH|nr:MULTISPECIES: glycerol-3-phosphate transporter [Aneurinibacillus]MED0674525.1 glycerol-3-phosphate transporter [Aneurinibacillus thermoaerophilus]MED0679168.1 glycerol-3-phosphate transporter [Aneurinibacillus thermoaerophilus]MED0738233.1 glycerol-3-phosphate transporter [Aneurinibacillus thermoaerophilus]MED0757478.1 glycerol-3-phosphate transporter [Aneurinibacillus thermoaerophilus]MED0761793.1 glycerol-3-phosphate transporter [Aneurinibacillus thermoaerophilus]